jgi:hypothetical protein
MFGDGLDWDAINRMINSLAIGLAVATDQENQH